MDKGDPDDKSSCLLPEPFLSMIECLCAEKKKGEEKEGKGGAAALHLHSHCITRPDNLATVMPTEEMGGREERRKSVFLPRTSKSRRQVGVYFWPSAARVQSVLIFIIGNPTYGRWWAVDFLLANLDAHVSYFDSRICRSWDIPRRR